MTHHIIPNWTHTWNFIKMEKNTAPASPTACFLSTLKCSFPLPGYKNHVWKSAGQSASPQASKDMRIIGVVLSVYVSCILAHTTDVHHSWGLVWCCEHTNAKFCAPRSGRSPDKGVVTYADQCCVNVAPQFSLIC